MLSEYFRAVYDTELFLLRELETACTNNSQFKKEHSLAALRLLRQAHPAVYGKTEKK